MQIFHSNSGFSAFFSRFHFSLLLFPIFAQPFLLSEFLRRFAFRISFFPNSARLFLAVPPFFDEIISNLPFIVYNNKNGGKVWNILHSAY